MEVREAVTVRVPPERAWALVGEAFGDIGRWAAPIVTSTMDVPAAPGSVRTCHIRGFGPVAPGVVKERLTRFDPVKRSLAYEWVEGRPLFVVHALNRWSVHGTGPGACTVRVHVTLTLHPSVRPFVPLLRWWMRRDAGRVLDELGYRLENGTPHPRKVAAIIRDTPTVR
jgi:hypothetical protein